MAKAKLGIRSKGRDAKSASDERSCSSDTVLRSWLAVETANSDSDTTATATAAAVVTESDKRLVGRQGPVLLTHDDHYFISTTPTAARRRDASTLPFHTRAAPCSTS